MTRKAFSVLCAVALLLLAAAAAGAQDAPQPGVSLTIYNRGTALVQDRRTFELQAGVSTLDFTDVAATIDPTSVSFKSLTDPAGTIVLEQNYVYDLVDSAALLRRYLDEQIQVTTQDGAVYAGQLLSGRGSEIILRQDDGQVAVVRLDKIRDVRFPALPEGLITRPTLRWLLQSAGGPQQVELTYLAGGMNWSADYIVLLANGGGSLDLNGWVTLTNTSGTSYADAQVKLVAGDVNRLPERGVETPAFEVQDMAMPTAAAAPQVEQRDIFEYKLYEIQRPVTVANNETKQVEFVTSAGVPATTFYVYDAGSPFYGYYGPVTDQYYGQSDITTVQNWLEFSTGEDGGANADLPAGRIRVYQEDVDGAALLIGENTLDHTPKGEKVQLLLGNAFDLVGERTQTSFQFIARNVIEETYEIKLRNRKEDQAVEIRVPERLFRWSNWEVLAASDAYTRLNAWTIEFRATVEPGQEKVITYTVRYTWPN
ncbi:MAG: hypothetical protein DWB42_09380 [Chloroflexi bacterium]|nr:hypothetical protein [Chloroflexota bacterium]MDL1882617.1 hypothetical protein [Anaerolineae bacterium CFX8]